MFDNQYFIFKANNIYLCCMKYYTIPVFVPELACPNRCVFCNQNSISGCDEQPGLVETEQIIEERLSTIPKDNSHIEIGFFGGNFTGIEYSLQRSYLSIAYKYLSSGAIHGIRLSTRPDYIDIAALNLLKEYGVTTVELGAQSLDDDVLKQAGRGHSVAEIGNAARLIKERGFTLGLQMMTGLPGDTPEKSINTAKKIIELGASNTRIYPTLVIKHTKLADLWAKGLYMPQTLEESINLTATLLEVFRQSGVKVIRVGLHPSEELISGGEMLAGPYHPNYRQLAETEMWRRKFAKLIEAQQPGNEVTHLKINLLNEELHGAIGFNGSNKSLLENHFHKVEYISREESQSPKPIIIADKRIPLPSKNKLKNMGQVFFIEDQLCTYKSIASHPDIFMCAGEKQIVIAPHLNENIKIRLQNSGYEVLEGSATPGRKYPETAIYNAVVTKSYIIHNLKFTDPVILETFRDKEKIHLNQGYTRCNLLPLNDTTHITSDKGIEKVLVDKGCSVLFVDPKHVLLKGQNHGFFPGCCGIHNDTVIINGNLKYHPCGQEIEEFILKHNAKIISLYDGPLRDVGSIFFFDCLNNNTREAGNNQSISINFETINSTI